MFDIQREKLDWCGREFDSGNRPHRAPGRRRGACDLGRNHGAGHRRRRQDRQARHGFLPAHRPLSGKGLCRRPHSRRLSQARRPPLRVETLVSRLIDRPIRPLFPDGFRCDTQVIVTVLSHDLENDPDILALVAASAALTLSGIPFMGPIGAARVGYIKDEIKVNPTLEEMKDSALDLVVAGTRKPC